MVENKNKTEQWIWLPKNIYSENQTTNYSGFADKSIGNYTVAEFKRTYTFTQKPISVEFRFSGDTLFQLFCNDKIIATGPACVGGDYFLGNDTRRDNFYAFETEIVPETNELNLFARVQMMPVQLCDYSKGHGGFMLSGVAKFQDGTQKTFKTDSSWMTRKNGAYVKPFFFNGNISPDEFVNAEIIENIWNTQTAPIPIREEKELFAEGCTIVLNPHEEKSVELDYDKIYAGFLHIKAITNGILTLNIDLREIDDHCSKSEEIIFGGDGEYRGFFMHSAGNIKALIKNQSEQIANVEISFISTHYPVRDEATNITSDEDINLVLDVCRHTLKICRQTHHLDSPTHCEPMACTGDYYIESLMTLFSFGDMRLAEFDLQRTAVMLERENGRMFHTTYSLIFVRMLYDVYMATGNLDLLRNCEKAIRLLLNRFETYIGSNGLIETPPDYMFIDWIYIDELSMHHPPKALGQSCLNMYYFEALNSADKIFKALSMETDAEICCNKKENLRKAINTYLFDTKNGIYFEGLNTPTEERLIGEWMPQNTKKRYYLKHSNILAACFGVCEDKIAKRLIDKIMSNEIEGEYQPYFMHFLLEAVSRLNLCEQYTLKIIERWKKPVKECSKGLVEGFVAPEPTYCFDHSHAWGGTPLYSLPKALLGLKILKPGMKEIRLNPKTLGLQFANVELMTPYGKVTCKIEDNNIPCITYPEEITVLLDS